MEINKGLTTIGYTERHLGFVEEFCKECQAAGYKNNESLEAMKLEWCLSRGGQFFLTYINDRIISLSGCHPLPEAGDSAYRVLFRGATLPEYQNLHGTLSKTHMNSIPFYYHIPRQINWAKTAGYTTYAVTTNHNNKDGIQSMDKSHRVFKLLEKQNIVGCLHEQMTLFNTEQSVWNLNVDNYFSFRSKFKERNNFNV
jgi:hypothetical protein